MNDQKTILIRSFSEWWGQAMADFIFTCLFKVNTKKSSVTFQAKDSFHADVGLANVDYQHEGQRLR